MSRRCWRACAAKRSSPLEIEVVRGVRPNGRARNLGVARTSAPLLVFVDDDAVLGDERVIERLVAPLLADPSIGVTGASKLLPPDAPWFQRWVAREVPRIIHPIVDQPLESNPDPPSFYCEITTTCCAMRREVFDAAGGFDEALLRGVDTEFFVRIGASGTGDWRGACSIPDPQSSSRLPISSRPTHLGLPPRAGEPARAAAQALPVWRWPRAGGAPRPITRARAGAADAAARGGVRAVPHGDRAPEHLPALLVRRAILAAGLQAAQGADIVCWRAGVCVGLVC